MAKCAFSKLNLKLDTTVSTIDFNGHPIEVKKYLPMTEKLEMISKVINNSVDDNGYYNDGKVQVYFAIELMKYYTNLTFTDKQQEDPCKLYDLLVSNGLLEQVQSVIEQVEYVQVYDILYNTIHAIYEYKNSVMGILENISTDYENLNLDISALQQKLTSAPESMALLKDVVTKLG